MKNTKIRTLILAGALSISSLLVGCQSTETIEQVKEVEQVYNISPQEHEEFFHYIMNKQREDFPNRFELIRNAYLEGNMQELIDEDNFSSDSFSNWAILSLEYFQTGKTGHCDKEGCLSCQEAIETCQIFDKIIREYEEVEQEVEQVESNQETYGNVNSQEFCNFCGSEDHLYFECPSVGEVDYSESVTQCANCGSHNIDVVDNTGGYICLDCDYME